MRVLISGRSALVFIREEEWGTSRGASALSRRCDYGGVRAEMGPILLPVDSRQRYVLLLLTPTTALQRRASPCGALLCEETRTSTSASTQTNQERGAAPGRRVIEGLVGPVEARWRPRPGPGPPLLSSEEDRA
ncbi:unnamed protein product [Gadus morhua 'NCC']